MRIQRHTVICLEGWYYLCILAFIIGGAILREINLLVVLAGMMIGPLLINLRYAAMTLNKLEVRRRLPRSVCAGDLLVVEITAANRRRRLASWAVVAEDRLVREGNSGEEAAAVQALLPHVAPQASAATTYSGRLMQRGRYRFGPLRISTRFPLGLVRRTHVADGLQTLLVYPRLGRLSARWRASLQAEGLIGQRSQARQGDLEGEFYGLRDWRPGDSHRRIHWRTSARRSQLAVRQFERQHDVNLALVVELWSPDPAGEQHRECVEQVVSFAATVAADYCRRGGGRLTLAVAGAENHVLSGASSGGLLQSAMDVLAVVQPGSGDELPQTLSRALAMTSAGTRLVVVSTRPGDLADAGRFRSIFADPRAGALLRQATLIRAGAGELEDYFLLEPPAATGAGPRKKPAAAREGKTRRPAAAR